MNPPEGIVGPEWDFRQTLGPYALVMLTRWQLGWLVLSSVALRVALADKLPLALWFWQLAYRHPLRKPLTRGQRRWTPDTLEACSGAGSLS